MRPWLRAVLAALLALACPAAAGAPGVLVEVWETVRERFHDPALNGLDWQAVRQRYEPEAARAASADELAAVINRMLAELGASHTAYYTRLDPEYYQLLAIFRGGPMRHELERLFPDGRIGWTGIGIETERLDGRLFVRSVLDGAPGQQAGLRFGDEILAAAGGEYHPVRSFEDKAGTAVPLLVRREPPPAEPFELPVVPRWLDASEIFFQAMEHSVRLFERGGRSIGYVHVWSYAGEPYHELLQQLLAAEPLRGADALLLDLRDGWGGANPGYLSLFNPRVPQLTMIQRDGTRSVYDPQWRRPVGLLVNAGSRSGKEILAHGFRRFGLGPVIGSTTAGAVLGGQPFLLSDGSLLYLAVLDVLVDGERLEGRGVEPDFPVPVQLPYAAGSDVQLERALEILSTRGGP
jgi:carboxyl-terminal processing protease